MREEFGFVWGTARYRDHRPVDGYLLPHRVEISLNLGGDLHTLTVDAWEPGVPLRPEEYAKDPKDSWEVHLQKLIRRNRRHRYGPYNNLHIDAALEDAGMKTVHLTYVMAGLELPSPPTSEVSIDTIDALLRQIHERIPEWQYPHQFILSTTSRKYPGSRHGVAFRKTAEGWLLFDSEMEAPEPPPPRRVPIRVARLALREMENLSHSTVPRAFFAWPFLSVRRIRRIWSYPTRFPSVSGWVGTAG